MRPPAAALLGPQRRGRARLALTYQAFRYAVSSRKVQMCSRAVQDTGDGRDLAFRGGVSFPGNSEFARLTSVAGDCCAELASRLALLRFAGSGRNVRARCG